MKLHHFGVAAALLTVAAGLTACGGDSGSGTVSDSVVSQATKDVAKFVQRPTEPEVTQPISKPIPTGKNIDFLTCSSPGCATIADAFKQAADIVGWNVKVLTVDPTADAIGDAYNTAIRDEPDAVAVAAVSSDVVHPQLDKLKELGIPVVTVQDPDKKFGPIIETLYDHTSSKELGVATADYLLSQGCGDGQTVYVQVSGYLVLKYRLDSYTAHMKQVAPDAKTKVVNIDATTDDPSKTIVSAVRATSNASCLYLSSDGFISGLPQALKAAGVPSSVKIVTDFGGETTLQYIRDGLVTATNFGDSGAYGFIYIDTLARYFAGESTQPDADAHQTIWFVDKSNVPSDMPFSAVEDLQSKYAKIWGK
jgi:ABC-type sugar transport system substrate-binding protein